MILLLDNQDSFTFNLAGLLASLGESVRVERTDRISVEQVHGLRPRALVISPGPGVPGDRGIGLDFLQDSRSWSLPCLGVCLGHQMMVVARGGSLRRSPEIHHGRPSLLDLERDPLFDGIPSPCSVMRYHSWVADEGSLGATMTVTARTRDGAREVMAVRHRDRPWVGVQFHPESYLTPGGEEMMRNWLRDCGRPRP
jgi:anthranilate synthase/aminodeoxychorismate synthase-like glutamine amidotransferase